MKFIKVKNIYIKADSIISVQEPKQSVKNSGEIIKATYEKQPVPERTFYWYIEISYDRYIRNFYYETFEEAKADIDRILQETQDVVS